MVNVTFFGVRGSTPCPSPANARYGGNTACVVVDRPGAERDTEHGSQPIILDIGTGLRAYGETVPADVDFRGSAFVTHLHWDHVQGLPFFLPTLRPGGVLDVYGPPPEPGTSLGEAFAAFMRPPYFPVTIADLKGDISFHDFAAGTVSIGDATITAAPVPHVGVTNGYRLDWAGVSVAYVSDHQQPDDQSFEVDQGVLDLCRDVDLLIHDAQYTADEFAAKCDWGHCTVDYAVQVANQCGARRLALFHHDPMHDDGWLDCLLGAARTLAAPDLEVISAYEGLTIALS
ncbi:MAG: MBL fold metallo-hydrolase [Acidimicrobiales bacterium]